MTSWMKERDSLLAQTMAFVQGVAAQRPIRVPAAETGDDGDPSLCIEVQVADDRSSIEIDTPIPAAVPEASAPSGDHPAPQTVSAIVAATQSQAQPEMTRSPPRPDTYQTIEMTLPERDVIARRVARFRAGQQKILQQREEYYEALRDKIRESLRTKTGDDPYP